MLERYKEILKELGYSGKDISMLLGMGYNSYRSITRKKSKRLPHFVRGFVVCYEIMKLGSEKK